MRHNILCFCLVSCCILFCIPYSSDAASKSKQVREAFRCTRYIAHYERIYSIPVYLLSAISEIESGRAINKRRMPWPWTINVGGKGHYFKRKSTAVKTVRRLMRSGKTNIDIGCMQVNYGYHGDQFSDISVMFDPRANVQYAAKLLRKLYDENKSWSKAVAFYHSRRQSRGRNYVKKVLHAWRQLIKATPTEFQVVVEREENRKKSPMVVYSAGQTSPKTEAKHVILP